MHIETCPDPPNQGRGVPEKDLKRVFDRFYHIPVPEGGGLTIVIRLPLVEVEEKKQ